MRPSTGCSRAVCRVSEQELNGPEIARAPIDQSGFVRRNECVPNNLGSTADPLGDETGILAGGHAGVRTATTREQELARSLVRSLHIIIDRSAGPLAQFKSDGLFSFVARLRDPPCSRRRRHPRPGW